VLRTTGPVAYTTAIARMFSHPTLPAAAVMRAATSAVDAPCRLVDSHALGFRYSVYAQSNLDPDTHVRRRLTGTHYSELTEAVVLPG
jgi:hypothetical protein